jgi:hypothetical protein
MNIYLNHPHYNHEYHTISVSNDEELNFKTYDIKPLTYQALKH